MSLKHTQSRYSKSGSTLTNNDSNDGARVDSYGNEVAATTALPLRGVVFTSCSQGSAGAGAASLGGELCLQPRHASQQRLAVRRRRRRAGRRRRAVIVRQGRHEREAVAELHHWMEARHQLSSPRKGNPYHSSSDASTQGIAWALMDAVTLSVLAEGATPLPCESRDIYLHEILASAPYLFFFVAAHTDLGSKVIAMPPSPDNIRWQLTRGTTTTHPFF